MMQSKAQTKRVFKNGVKFLVIVHLFVMTLYGQSGNVSGTVTDASRRVLVGAQIQVEGQPRSTSSDESGKSRETPPAIANVFIPGCSTAQEGFPCEWTAFRKTIGAAIDPAFVN